MVLNQAAPSKEMIYAECERFLAGHGRMRPHDELAALAAATAPDELADVYGAGALIEEFEREIATILGKEAALFLPTGTMAQQIALRIWSEWKQHSHRRLSPDVPCRDERREGVPAAARPPRTPGWE